MKLGAKLQMYYNEEVGLQPAFCFRLWGGGCRLSVAAAADISLDSRPVLPHTPTHPGCCSSIAG